MPLGSMNAYEVAAVGTVVPVGGVFLVGNQCEATGGNRISLQRRPSHLAETGQLRGSGQHLATVDLREGDHNRFLQGAVTRRRRGLRFRGCYDAGQRLNTERQISLRRA